jgi:hypothetical protein
VLTHHIGTAALDAIMAEWGSSDSFDQRWQALESGVGPPAGLGPRHRTRADLGLGKAAH